MRLIILVITLLGVLFSGVFAVMASTPLQSVAVILIGVACVLSSVGKLQVRLGMLALIVSATGVLFFSARAFLSPVFDLGLGDLFLLLPAAGIYFLYVSGGVSRKHFFWGVISVVCTLGVLNAALLFFPSLNEWRDSVLPFAKGNEESGLYNHRNFCSNMLMMVVLIAFAVGIWIKDLGLRRWLLFLIAAIGIVGLVLAPARGGFIGMTVGIVFIVSSYFMLANIDIKKRVLMSSLTLILGIGVCIGGVMLFSDRGETLTSTADVGSRKQYFAIALDQVPDAPLVGSGSMSYSYLSHQYWGDLHHNIAAHVWVHNEFLQALTDYGIIGLILVLLFIALCISSLASGVISSVSHGQNIAPVYKIKLIGLAVMLGFLINACVSFPAHAQPNFLVFAFICSVVILRLHSADKIEKVRKVSNFEMFNQVMVRMLLLFIGVSSLLLGYKEWRALRVFSKHGIYVDNAYWEPKEHLNDGWHEALNEVIKVSPSYKRYERLAGIILEKSKAEMNTEQRMKMYRGALEYSNLSLDRHPFYSVSLSNKITSLHGLERFEEASLLYDRFFEQTKYQQKVFDPVNTKLIGLLGLSKKLAVEGDIEQSRITYEQAYNLLVEPIKYRLPVPLELSSSIVIDRANLLMHMDEREELELFWSDYYNDKFPHVFNKLSDSELLYEHAKVILRYAEKKFYSRQPELAFKWYKWAYRCYDLLNRKFVTVKVMDEKDKLQKQIQFLKTAGIIPIK